MGLDLIQRQSDIENGHKLHFLRKAVEQPFVLNKLSFWTLQAFSLLPLPREHKLLITCSPCQGWY